MRLAKIFAEGQVLNKDVYEKLKVLDTTVTFPGCGNEFLKNREWWVIMDNNKIVAYCGCSFSEGVCRFVRAWVQSAYRGQGLQRRMIKARLRTAIDIYGSEIAITYTMPCNFRSSNNLIKTGFTLYEPSYKWVGEGQLYWFKKL